MTTKTNNGQPSIAVNVGVDSVKPVWVCHNGYGDVPFFSIGDQEVLCRSTVVHVGRQNEAIKYYLVLQILPSPGDLLVGAETRARLLQMRQTLEAAEAG